MVRFLIRSVVSTIITILLVSIGLFVLLEVGSGDISVKILGVFSTPEQRASYRAQLGLNAPVWQRYLWADLQLLMNRGEEARLFATADAAEAEALAKGLFEGFAQVAEGQLLADQPQTDALAARGDGGVTTGRAQLGEHGFEGVDVLRGEAGDVREEDGAGLPVQGRRRGRSGGVGEGSSSNPSAIIASTNGSMARRLEGMLLHGSPSVCIVNPIRVAAPNR